MRSLSSIIGLAGILLGILAAAAIFGLGEAIHYAGLNPFEAPVAVAGK